METGIIKKLFKPLTGKEVVSHDRRENLNQENLRREKKRNIREDQNLIVNTGIGPGEYPDLSSGTDIDAASS